MLAVPLVASANNGYRLLAVVVSLETDTEVPDETVAQDVLVPSVVRYLPELLVWLGANALNAVLAVVCPVPPLAIARVPVTPVDKGKPVKLVAVPPDGVPKAPPLTTTAPDEPVLTARAVATPVPRPDTPVEIVWNPQSLLVCLPLSIYKIHKCQRQRREHEGEALSLA